jgi:hypothetical protein
MRSVSMVLYCIANKGLVKECDKGTKCGSNWAASLILSIIILPIVTYWYSHRQTGAPTINSSQNFARLLICVKSFIAVLFGSNGNSYTVCTASDMCVCTHVVHNMEIVVWESVE